MAKPKKRFVILEHKADLKIKVLGEDTQELFINAAWAMMDFLFPSSISKKAIKITKSIEIKANNLSSLLVNWLSELLYLSDVNDSCFNRYNIKKLTPTEIKAVAGGYKTVASQDIKAVTYHELNITKTNEGLEATIIFDI